MDDTQQPAVQVTIRHGLSRGHLTRDKLREATGRAERAGVSMRPWREALHAYLHSDASPLRELGASS